MTRRTRTDGPRRVGMNSHPPETDLSPNRSAGPRLPVLPRLPVGGAASPVAPYLVILIPRPGEEIPWTSALRADVPLYVMEQLHEASHQQRCTIVSLLLQLMAKHRDPDGRPLFYIRTEDLVPDRRRARR